MSALKLHRYHNTSVKCGLSFQESNKGSTSVTTTTTTAIISSTRLHGLLVYLSKFTYQFSTEDFSAFTNGYS